MVRAEGCRYVVLPHLLVEEMAVSVTEIQQYSPSYVWPYLISQLKKWPYEPTR
jgi:hypothetical protein